METTKGLTEEGFIFPDINLVNRLHNWRDINKIEVDDGKIIVGVNKDERKLYFKESELEGILDYLNKLVEKYELDIIYENE